MPFGYREVLNSVVNQPTYIPFLQRLVESLENRQGEKLAVMDMLQGIDEIIRKIGNETAVGVSNDSFKDEFGTSPGSLKMRVDHS